MAVVWIALFVLLYATFENLRLTIEITLLVALIENIKKGRCSCTTYAVPKSLKSFSFWATTPGFSTYKSYLKVTHTHKFKARGSCSGIPLV